LAEFHQSNTNNILLQHIQAKLNRSAYWISTIIDKAIPHFMRANSLQFDQKEYAMTTILYREITSDGQHTEIIEEFSQLDLKNLPKPAGKALNGSYNFRI
jgi:hypothetical protein